MVDSRYESAFPHFTDEQLAAIETHARVVTFQDGEYLWRTGDVDFCMFVVKSGHISVIEENWGKAREITVHERGEFTGDIDLLSGRPSIVSGVAVGDCTAIMLTADCVRSIVRLRPEMGDVILSAFIMRRVLLLEKGFVGIRVIGSRFSSETHSIREFLARNRIPFTWQDLERDQEVQTLLDTLQIGPEETPVVMLQDGTPLKNPSTTDLGERLGIRRSIRETMYDLVVVGAGPAGLAAAVYGASEGLKTLLLDKIAPGGQAGASSKIENYMGFPMGLSGQELADRGLLQAEKFGAAITVPTKVVKLECGNGNHLVEIDGGRQIGARAVILATGAQYRKLDVPGYENFEMTGIYYAATGVEAQLCKGEEVAVVGAGNSAGQAAVFLSQSVRKVWVLVRGDNLEKSMSSYLARRLEAIENIEILTECEVCGLEGDNTLKRVEVVHKPTQGTRCFPVAALFVFTGAVPQTQWASTKVKLDHKGFVMTGAAVANDPSWTLPRAPFFLETTCPGIFAVGDVRSGSVKRVASAVGEGSMAVAFVHEYLQGA